MKHEELEEKFSRLSQHINELIEDSTIVTKQNEKIKRKYEEIKDLLPKMYAHSIKQQKKIEKYEAFIAEIRTVPLP